MQMFYFPACSLFIIVLIVSCFYARDRLKAEETILYNRLIILNLFETVFSITVLAIGYNFGSTILVYLFNRFDFVCCLMWIWNFFLYIAFVSITSKNGKIDVYKKIAKVSAIANILVLICILFLPLEIYTDGDIAYAYGLSTDVLYLSVVVYLIGIVICLIYNHKNLKNRKYIPLYALIFLVIITLIVRKINPGLIIISAIISYIDLIMYFTIENPDMKLLEEVHKSKEISDNANEEKTMFLYNMTQEIRGITNNINDYASLILDSKDWTKVHDSARDIMANTSKFTNMTNEILDVNTIDETTIKVYNSKYNIKNLLKQIVNIYTDVCKDKELKFITNIDHGIPETMYGDSISLKEVLTTVLNNSVKYTEKGYIELNVNTIIKNDICRLIFTIEDSGKGIRSEDVTKIKIDDKSLGKANKLITLMNGTMIVSSDYGIGTKVKIILDQKIEKETDNEITKYESNFDNISILSVDDSESGLKIIEKLLKGTNIKLDLATTGKECLDKIKVCKYDLILLDEELSQISGIDLMKKIKALRNFKTPVLLLTKDNSYEYNEEYLKIGFSDYILKPLKKDILLSKINEYTKKEKE